MNISKHVLTLIFIPLPSCLLGMEIEPTTPPVANDWIAEARACPQTGTWTVKDKTDKTVLVEGELISPENHKLVFPECNTESSLLYTIIGTVESTLKLKSKNRIRYLFTVSDLLSENKNLLLGAVIFTITKWYHPGTVLLEFLSVKPKAQGRGLSTILESALFKLLPQIKRIVLIVASTNTKALKAYKASGFTECNCFTSAFEYEYLTANNSKLKDAAYKLQAIFFQSAASV